MSMPDPRTSDSQRVLKAGGMLPRRGFLRPARGGRPEMSVVQRVVARAMRRSSVWSAMLLILLVAIFGAITPSNFLSQASWAAIALTASTTLLLAFGEVFVIIGGGIDISLAGNIGLTGIAGSLVMGHFAENGKSAAAAILIGLLVMIAIGTGIGMINGLVVTRMKVNPFVATLAMSSVALGAAELLNAGADVNNVPLSILKVGNRSVLHGWLPIPMLIALGFGVLAAIALHKTRFGGWTYLIGSNNAASGVLEFRSRGIWSSCTWLAAHSLLLRRSSSSRDWDSEHQGQVLEMS